MSNPDDPTTPQPGDVPPPPPPTPGQPQPAAPQGGQPPASQYSSPQQGYGQPAGQPYQQYQYGTQKPYPPREPSAFSALFDMGFQRYATPMIAKMIYVFVVIGAILMVVTGIVAGIGVIGAGSGYNPYLGEVSGPSALSVIMGLIVMVGGVIGALVWLATYRLVLEFFVTQFHAAGHIRKIAEKDDK